MPNTNELTLIIKPGGVMEFIYQDSLAFLTQMGPTTIKRASHVEPTESGCQWTADMSPINGPILGPFALRKEALDAEVQWIETNYLSKGDCNGDANAL